MLEEEVSSPVDVMRLVEKMPLLLGEVAAAQEEEVWPLVGVTLPMKEVRPPQGASLLLEGVALLSEEVPLMEEVAMLMEEGLLEEVTVLLE